MSSTAPHSESSLRVARRLLARAAAPAGREQPAAPAAALQRALDGVCERLGDALGPDGRNALLARALSHTEKDHPALRQVRRIEHDMIQLDGLVAAAEAVGNDTVTAAVEALLAAVIDVLSRLIGEDMAVQLIEHDETGHEPGGTAAGR